MGRMITSLAAEDHRFEITAAVEKNGNECIGWDVGIVAGIGKLGVTMEHYATDFDVIVDFTEPAGTISALQMALENRAGLVTGTTGLDNQTIGRLKDESDKIAIFVASNFSRGIAFAKIISKKAAKALPNADIEIVEAHHRNKADAPSGTALDIAHELAETRELDFEENLIFGRKGKTGIREKNQIAVNAVRGGGIIGDHKIIFAMPYETLIIEHRAISREVFAAGALDAAEFVCGKTGFYEMNDLIN